MRDLRGPCLCPVVIPQEKKRKKKKKNEWKWEWQYLPMRSPARRPKSRLLVGAAWLSQFHQMLLQV
jgi:hypothetical protein